MVAPVVVAGAARAAAFARPVVMGSMKKTMQTTARGGAKVGSRSAIRGSAGTGTATRDILNATMVQDSMSLLDTVDQVSKSPSDPKPGKALTAIRDSIINLGSIFSSKISGLNKHLAFRLETLNTTMTTIGKVLADDLDLEKKTFDEMKQDQEDREREESLEDKDKPKRGIFGKLFDGIKGAFGSIIDFLTPSKELVQVGLAGLLVAAIFVFKDKIQEVFTDIFTYLGSLKDAFDEGGFKGLGTKIKDDIQKYVINPSLAPLGLEVKEDGTIGRIQGSFFDVIDPFTGETNIFKTIRSLRTGINEYDNNKKIYPEWYYKGFMENLDDIITPEDPDMLVNAVKSVMNGITRGISEFFTDTEIVTPDGAYTQKSGMSKMKDQMMKNFRNNMQGIKEFFHDEDGNLFGIDFKALKDLLPTIQEIAESIYNALPQWARPDTLAEKNVDRDIERLKDIGFFDKDLITDSDITRSKIDQASPGELKSLLSKEKNDLSKEDIQFIENKIIEKESLIEKNKVEKVLPEIVYEKESIKKTDSLEKVISEKSNGQNANGQPINIVADTSRKSNVSNYSKTDIVASEFRTEPFELSAQEQLNFFRNR